MYIEVELENGEVVEFWGVRSWSRRTNGNLSIYFYDEVISDGTSVGFLEGGKVVQSFADGNYIENNQDFLKLLR